MSFFGSLLKRKGNTAESQSPRLQPLETPKNSLVGTPVCLQDHGNTVFCCTFSQGNTGSQAIDLATASYDGTTRVWDVAKCQANAPKKCRRILQGNVGGVWCCQYTHDSNYLISGCSKSTICIYSAAQRYELLGKQELSHGPNAVFSCNTGVVGGQNMFATGGGDSMLKLWSLNSSPSTPRVSPKLQGNFAAHSGDVVSCCFRPNTNQVLSGSEDRHIRVWDIETQDCVQTLIGHTAEVCSCTFDRHASLLASGSSDKSVRLWDVRQKNRCVETLIGHDASVYSVAFRRECFDLLASTKVQILTQKLAHGSASQDGTVAIWDPRMWKCAQYLRQHAGEVVGLAWHPTGNILASGSADMTVNLYCIRATPPEAHELINQPVSTSPLQPSSNGSVESSSSSKTASNSVLASPMVMEISSEMVPAMNAPTTTGRAHLGEQASALKVNLRPSTQDVDERVRRELELNLAQHTEFGHRAMEADAIRNQEALKGSRSEEDVQDLRTCLHLFYKTYNPEKIVNVEQIVRDYAARGGGAWERKALNEDLRAVYGFDLTSVQGRADEASGHDTNGSASQRHNAGHHAQVSPLVQPVSPGQPQPVHDVFDHIVLAEHLEEPFDEILGIRGLAVDDSLEIAEAETFDDIPNDIPLSSYSDSYIIGGLQD